MLDYPYFKENYKLLAADLSKQQKQDADPKTVQQINFTENLNQAGNTQMFFIIEAKEIFQKEQLKYCDFILFKYNINIKRLNNTLKVTSTTKLFFAIK